MPVSSAGVILAGSHMQDNDKDLQYSISSTELDVTGVLQPPVDSLSSGSQGNILLSLATAKLEQPSTGGKGKRRKPRKRKVVNISNQASDGIKTLSTDVGDIAGDIDCIKTVEADTGGSEICIGEGDQKLSSLPDVGVGDMDNMETTLVSLPEPPVQSGEGAASGEIHIGEGDDNYAV